MKPLNLEIEPEALAFIINQATEPDTAPDATCDPMTLRDACIEFTKENGSSFEQAFNLLRSHRS